MLRVLVINIFIFFVVFFTNYVNASNLDPEKILDNVDDIYRSNASHGIITLAVTTVNWQRTLTLELWSKGQDKTLIKVLKPKKEKDLATLRVDKNVWNYMPKVKRVIKIPSSMMSSSWSSTPQLCARFKKRFADSNWYFSGVSWISLITLCQSF